MGQKTRPFDPDIDDTPPPPSSPTYGPPASWRKGFFIETGVAKPCKIWCEWMPQMNEWLPVQVTNERSVIRHLRGTPSTLVVRNIHVGCIRVLAEGEDSGED